MHTGTNTATTSMLLSSLHDESSLLLHATSDREVLVHVLLSVGQQLSSV